MRAPASIRTRGYSRHSTAPPSSSAPGTSMRGSRPCVLGRQAGTRRTIATSATRPIGTLTRNSQRQPFSSPASAMIAPPRTGPTPEEIDTVSPK